MLQRAASNAYSWWWASHIRTKQSKWLEQNLQDMEEKVEMVLKLIEEDGDSFAKRAEMYYKKRPELISFVEESYRAYRALAERYDHISTELQNANNTIASVFPEQVQFAIDEEDEQQQQQQQQKKSPPNTTTKVPIAPKAPAAETPKKSLLRKKTMKRMASSSAKTVAKSGLEKPEAMLEIDRLQKEILSLQTEKEFVKSSYESGVAKYWEIESLIKEKQDRVSSLQDEFGGEGVVIDDSEARSLMAEAALRSCQHKLALLQERHNTSSQEAMLESTRIEDVRDKLDSLKLEFHSIRNEAENKPPEEDALKNLESLRDKIKDQLEPKKKNSDASLTVAEMVEKIDELVSKVIGLESAVSSQAALVERLRSETDELQAQIRSLEGDKAVLINGKNLLSNKLKEMEEKLDGILVMDKSFKDQNDNLRVHFTEANCSLGHLSDKLQCVRPDEEETVKVVGDDLAQQVQDIVVNPFVDFPTAMNPFVDFEEVQQLVSQPQKEEDDGEPDWQKMFENGMDNKEKTLLTEYTSTLRNYKEVKRKLGEAEKKNRDGASQTSLQVKELKSANAKKDEEIRSLRLKLGVLEDSLGSDSFGGFNTGLNLQQDNDGKEEEKEVDIKTLWTGQEQTMSATEEKFRMDIDELLEQNLDFWLRFSSSFHQIQKFDTEVEDLKSEIELLREKRNSDQDGDNNNNNAFKSDARPLYKHLREIQTELSVWLASSAALKEELECRFSSLCEIQEEITKALKASAEDDDFRFTSHQAAKFQGEVLNMKQENNKVADELQAGLDHIATMQIGIEATLVRLSDEFELAGSTAKKKTDTAAAGGGASSQLRHAVSRSRIPLRSFIFGVRSKKHKASIFACVTPGMSRKYHGLKAGPPF